MDKRRTPSGDEVNADEPGWRAILRRHADQILAGAGGADSAAAKRLARALGPLADDALKIVEALSLIHI